MYFHARDPKTGIPRDERAGADMRAFFYSVWRKRGLEQHQIDQKWTAWVNEQQKKMPMRGGGQ